MNPTIILKGNLDLKSYTHINNLQRMCLEHDRITQKLELDSKLSRSERNSGSLKSINEFMCYEEELLIGYIGICNFGGEALEVNGMVHPDYRRQGVFKTLFSLVRDEWNKRGTNRLLLLSDRNSSAGLEFIKSIPKAKHDHTEYEMFLQSSAKQTLNPSQVVLRKATNEDAKDIARQNSRYFGKVEDENRLMPEEEEKNGLIIYMAEINNSIIGKVHIDVSSSVGGIYGLGVLPEYRRKGYGRGVLTLAIEKLKEYNVKDIMLQVDAKNEKALTLYRSCGFEVTSTMDYYELFE